MRNTVVDDNEFLFTKKIDTFSRNRPPRFFNENSRGGFRNELLEFLSWILPSKYPKNLRGYFAWWRTLSHGGIDRKVRTAFLKFHRGGDAGLEFRDRLRKNASEMWTESIREEWYGEKKK